MKMEGNVFRGAVKTLNESPGQDIIMGLFYNLRNKHRGKRQSGRRASIPRVMRSNFRGR